MRYLVKTYLGSLASDAKCTALDILWYNFNQFGFQSSALSSTDKRMIAISGYDVDNAIEGSAEAGYFHTANTNLMGKGLSSTLWHDSVWVPNSVLPSWKNTNYFFGMTHESNGENPKSTIRAYHRYGFNAIIDKVVADTKYYYYSSSILWLWDIKNTKDPIFTQSYTTVTKYNNPDVGISATSLIYSSGTENRFKYSSYTNLFESIKQFGIYTSECIPATVADQKRMSREENKECYQSIKFLFGSVRRSFSHSYGYDSIGAEDIPWQDGMCLDNWSTHDNISPVSIMQPEDSKITFNRGTNNFGREESDKIYIHSSAYVAISNVASGNNSSITIYSIVRDLDDEDVKNAFDLKSKRTVHVSSQFMRPFCINDNPDTLIDDNTIHSSISSFYTDDDVLTVGRSANIGDDDNYYYIFPII